MATTYTLISSVTVGSGNSASIEFTSIPQTYTDLILSWSGRHYTAFSSPLCNIVIELNGSTSNFSGIYLEGNGSSASSSTFARFVGVDNTTTSTSNTFSNNTLYIPNYTSSNYKSFSADSAQETNASSAQLTFNAGLWSNSNAITSLKILSQNSNQDFLQYSTAYLYGISNA